MSDLDTAGEPEGARLERHASWAELFFDLVAVAGVGTLAHVLETELDAAALGLYAVLFLAFWLTWTTFMLYGNVAAGQTRVIRLLAGMFGLGVMAASVPRVAHEVLGAGHGEGHSTLPLTAFTIAYVVTRVYGGHSWSRGEILLDFPVVQYSLGLLPWIVSIWADDDWKVALWALGVVLDLLVILVLSGPQMLAGVRARVSERWRTTKDRDVRMPVIRGVSVDPEHLAERLGLFVIIVLGESVIQIVNAAADAHYGSGLLITGLAAFLLLASIFALSVVYGHAGLPHLRAGHIPTRAAIGLHCLVTGVIATVAVSLAAVIEHGSEPLDDPVRWLLCGAVATYFALGVVTGLLSEGPGLRPTLVWVVTGIVVPLLLGAFGGDRGGRNVVICLVLVMLAHLVFEHRRSPRPAG
ncbi:low temperature requirement protein A [Kineosporia sp. J2-2]|uniref:Low temperature requirement protein A n=1 Tax=Kineosporia corallincola TaxID=2835133 RepID=A0ABS5TGD5_9ACTN|nr:low temperature requirement protein A [Kineosporia corallincola]MBT0770160.1 low temperature requirement protein A [Kineosporia corallincola]